MRFLYTVDTGGGDGTANFAELGSDFSEPGKHVWTFDMMSVLHVCLNSLCMAYGHQWVLCCMQGNYQCASNLDVIFWWEITWSCGDMKGGKMVLLKHASLMSTVKLRRWRGRATLPFNFPFRAATCFLQRIRFSKLQTSFLVHTK